MMALLGFIGGFLVAQITLGWLFTIIKAIAKGA